MKKKLFINIFGFINFLFFGVLGLITSILIYFYPEKILNKFKEVLVEKSNLVEISKNYINTANIINIIFSILFLISGIGLILKKEIIRRFTIYFSFLFLILFFLSALVNAAFITNIIIFVIYLIILILYLTSKDIQKYFK